MWGMRPTRGSYLACNFTIKTQERRERERRGIKKERRRNVIKPQ
jgi:hypothetical protein